MIHPVTDVLLHPALSLIESLDNHRPNLDFSDSEFISLGIRRIVTRCPSDRAFLQSVRQCDISDVRIRPGKCSSGRLEGRGRLLA
jgi:hypothetical protein